MWVRVPPRALMSINTNHWRTIEYHDPATVLDKVRAVKLATADASADADAIP
jgi:hypothetical protein